MPISLLQNPQEVYLGMININILRFPDIGTCLMFL